MFSIANEPMSCGKVSRKSAQRQRRKSVWKRKQNIMVILHYTEGDHNNGDITNSTKQLKSFQKTFGNCYSGI